MKPKKKPTKKLSGHNTLLESLLKYVFATLIIFIPLYPKFPLFNIPGTYVAVRSEDFILVLLAFLLLAHFLKNPLFFFRFTMTRSIFIFWLVGLIAIISGIFLTKTIPFHLGMLHWARRIEYMLPFFAGIILVRNHRNLIFFLKLIPLVALSVFAYGIAQLYFNAPVISTQNVEFSKGIALTLQPGVNLSSTFAGHYDLATYLTMTIALFAGLLAVPKKNLFRFLGVIFLLVLFWLQLRTGSRIAFGATIITVSLVFYLAKKPLWIIPVFFIAVIGLINTPSISGRFNSLIDIYRHNLEQKVKGVFDNRAFIVKSIYAQEETPTPTKPPENLRPIQQDRSTSIRFDVEWPRALRALSKNPFLGTGYGSISLATDNDYLRALGETGLLGFLALITVFINLLAGLIRGIKHKLPSLEHHFLLGSLSLFLSFLMIATFIDVFEASKVATLFWMYTGLAYGLTLNQS